MKRIYCLLLAMLLLLGGCGKTDPPPSSETTAPSLPPESVVQATVPAGGNSGDVTCLGSYTGPSDDTVVAAQRFVGMAHCGIKAMRRQKGTLSL